MRVHIIHFYVLSLCYYLKTFVYDLNISTYIVALHCIGQELQFLPKYHFRV